MTKSKPISFEQVRVRTGFDDAVAGPRLAGRVCVFSRAAAVFQWSRLTGNDSDANDGPPTAAYRSETTQEPAALPQGSPHARSLQAAVARDTSELPQPVPSTPEPAQTDLGSEAPESLARTAQARSQAVPISAIARSVRQAAVVRDLTGAIVELCHGEESQRLGPWDMTLGLDRHGLGRSVLKLRLSLGDLSLRFQCDGPEVLDLLSQATEKLSLQLEEQLHPPLSVHVELALG